MLRSRFFRLLGTVLGLVWGHITLAQTITAAYVPDPVCINTVASLPFTVAGQFESGNTFIIQIRNQYTQEILVQSQAFAASPAQVQLPSSLPNYTEEGRYQYRIVSSSPYAESAWTNWPKVILPAVVTLTGPATPAVNPYQPVTLQYAVQGSSPVSITLSDGTRQELSDCCNSTFTQNVTVYPERSTTYSITAVDNSCGVGAGNGTAALTVNPIAVKTVSASPAVVCVGNEFMVAYSKGAGSFGTGNTFKVRLISYNPFATAAPANARQYELDAVEFSGGLKVQLPSSFTATSSFYVQVLTTNPVTASDPTGVQLTVSPAASAQITTPSLTIDAGQRQAISVQARGRGPYQVVLNDSLQLAIDESNGTGIGNLIVRPRQTTAYRITSFQSTCGPAAINPSSTTVTVRQGISIDSLPGSGYQRGPVCEGQQIRLPVTLNFLQQSTTQYFVDFRYGSGGNVLASAPATLENGRTLVFTIPALPTDSSGFLATRNYSLRIRTTAPATEGASDPNQTLVVTRKPQPYFAADDRQRTLESPGRVALRVQNIGGGPFTYKLSGSPAQSNTCLNCDDLSVQVYAATTKTFKIDYFENSCGRVDNLSTTAVVTVENPNAASVEIDSVQQNKCNSDSIQVFFHTNGTFAVDNLFSIQAAASSLGEGWGWTDAAVVGQGTRSPIRIKLPDDRKVRISATNPAIASNEFQVSVNQKPTASLEIPEVINSYYLYGSEPNTIPTGSAVTLNVTQLTGKGPFTTVFTNGTTDFTATSGTSVTVKPVGKTTYRLKSIANACGVGTVSNQQITYVPQPYRIELPVRPATNTYYFTFCGGSSLSLPFITNPSAPAGTEYQLQLASRRDSVFSTIATTTTSPAVATIPASLTTGDYYLRLVAKNSDARTAALLVRVSQPPTAALITASLASVSAGSTVKLTVNLTGESPWQVVFSDKVSQSFTTSPAVRELTATTGQTYSIRTVTNGCGYGTATGEATIAVKPTVALTLTSAVGQPICAGQPVTFRVANTGDFAAGTTLAYTLINTVTKAETALTNATLNSGPVSLTLPTTVPAGTYQVRASTSGGQGETLSGNFTVSGLPAYSLSGNTVINAGQSTYLNLNNMGGVGTSEQVNYTLSNGFQGAFTAYGSNAIIQVAPTQTTSYSLVSVSNGCGNGRAAGLATVTVNAASDKTVTATNVSSDLLCSSTTIAVDYETTGTFTTGNTFTIQLSDSTGANFKALTTTGTSSPLRAVIPSGLPSSAGYRIRVVASDANVASGANPFTYRAVGSPTASFDSAMYLLQPGKAVQIKLRFTGDGPWTYSVQSGQISRTFTSTTKSAVLDWQPNTGAGSYQITGVSNACGVGALLEPSTTRVELVTATEPVLAPNVRIYPNPASDRVWIELTNLPKPVTVQVIDLTGRLLSQQRTSEPVAEISLTPWVNPIVLVRVAVDKTGQQFTYRILRQGN
ncbi:T9SS type A sorting domain-containing protein [Spirosoma sp. KUDC1026]|uniref:T9SS type A sorting domain-containing protein n=1 Tax=Spirosoma sp. KUDC1026 TaxID=2745947 RepID=UPI00159BD7DE|nr:T9SS type A sorting domain-containing protein [Spirosoma sp. KUDC1026]QKZ11246.1 T9SS type A sorting domain-containing protein [Spirosoma sp. KUDC1026]